MRALRDEIKTQKALAGLAGGDAARERMRRILEFGGKLGVADRLPKLEEVAAAPATATPVPGQQPPPAGGTPAPESPGQVDSQAESSPAPQPAPADPPLTGRQWLAAQNDGDLTLQIFAVNRLERVEQLIAAHPDLSVHILASAGASPRYRVFHGVFPDEAAARAAFDGLPADVSEAAGGAIVKSFAAVREDLETAVVPAAGVPAAPPADGYTLQLFASGNRGNAEALVSAFPALALRLHHLDGDPSPFRVIYGHFQSQEEARTAAATLPQSLLGRIGKPLPKAVAETGVRVP